jgi:secondary thiamine-phosphate synthase enzyme
VHAVEIPSAVATLFRPATAKSNPHIERRYPRPLTPNCGRSAKSYRQSPVAHAAKRPPAITTGNSTIGVVSSNHHHLNRLIASMTQTAHANTAVQNRRAGEIGRVRPLRLIHLLCQVLERKPRRLVEAVCRERSAMRQATGLLTIETRRQGLLDVTDRVLGWVGRQGMSEGLLTIFCRHTSASLVIQENAAPAVRRDMEAYFNRLAPESSAYEHDDEGPDDMPAHLKTALTGVTLSIPVIAGAPALGTWQGIYLFEHRTHPHHRSLALHLIGG